MRLLAAIFLLLPAVVLAACSGENGDEAYREAAEQAVPDAVLTVDDLPEGWTPSALGGVYTDLALTGDCALLNGRGAGFPGEIASADSEPLSGPADQELVSTVSAFTSTETAQEAVRLANDLVLQCTDQVAEALKEAIRRAAADQNLDQLLRDIDALVEPGAFANFGDETAAYRLRADFSAFVVSFQVNGHIIVIREGVLTGVLLFAVLGELNAEEEEGVAAALAAKLVEAEDSLSNE
jgi:hypothetical protein